MTRIAYAGQANADVSAVSLTRLLSRLEERLFLPENAPELARNPFLRTKHGVNLEYARSLLLRLEHESSAIKVQSRKQNAQTNLQAKRDQIKRLNERLQELEQLHADFDDDDGQSEEETADETDQASHAPAKPAFVGTDAGKEEQEPAPNILPQQSTSELRSRKAAVQQTPATATTTGAGVLFPSDYKPTKSTNPLPDPNLSQSEALLSHNRQEQENISDELLMFAQRLKESSLRFQSTLEQDKDVVDKAGAGLEKNTTGMESASSRMGTLRKMTEGRGWFARISLYGKIAILWVVALVIVFVLPKLRF